MRVLIFGARSASFQSSLYSRNTPGKLILFVSVKPGGVDALSLARPLEQVYLPAQTLNKGIYFDITV
jgi:hypothetical protein